jgi:hypothetical protein
LVFLFVMFLIVAVIAVRSQREKHRVELQKAILERVGSVKDFAEFLTTEQGERFLASLAPIHFSPEHRTLWSVRVGIVILTIGIFLMVAFHSPWFGSPVGSSTPPALLLGMLLLIATGIGMLVSAAVSFMIARSLGLRNGHDRSKKNDAV